MSKTLTADKVKKLPPGTDIILVNEATGERGMLWIVKSGRKKMARGVLGTLLEIADKPGWHYERADK